MVSSKRNYSTATIKKLFTLSYNQCVHPECTLPIIEPRTTRSDEAVVGQICHIYASSRKGPRGKKGLSAKARDAFKNLILCCGYHHPVIDKQHETYPAELLLEWKRNHEERVKAGSEQARVGLFDIRVFPRELVDAEIAKSVDLLKKSRFFPEFDRSAFAMDFGRRVLSGELSGGSESVRSLALGWCARILALTDECESAEEFLKAAKALHKCDEVSLAEAFLLFKSGSVSDAVKLLTKVNTSDAKTAALMLKTLQVGVEAALQWMADAKIAPSELDSDGKGHLIINLLHARRWGQAEQYAGSIVEPQDFESTPILYQTVAFAKLVQVVPEDLKSLVLTQVPFGADRFPLDDSSEGLGLRRDATRLFTEAAKRERHLGAPMIASFHEEIVSWLELRDASTREDAKIRLQAKLEHAELGLRYVSLALDFNLDVDRVAIENEIARQFALNGGYTFEGALARFTLTYMQTSAKAGVAYLDKYETELLESSFISPKSILLLKIEFLAKAGQTERAHECYDKLKREDITDIELERVKRIIDEIMGGDSLEYRRGQFKSTGAIQDLGFLVEELERQDDTNELVHYSRLLFDKTRSLRDGARLSHALFNIGEYEAVIGFFQENSSLLGQSSSLGVLLGWAYFNQGSIREAIAELRKLPAECAGPHVRGLKIGTAIASGDWNSLTAVLAHEYVKREATSAAELMGLAKLAFQINSPYALEFIISAVEKEAHNPQLLIEAYITATAAGIEDNERAARWLKKAIELSGSTGPLQLMSLDEIAERQPKWIERTEEVWDKLASAQIPLLMAGQILNRSLVELVLFPAITNPAKVDPRSRSAVPAYSGRRPLVEITQTQTIGLDVSALLSIGYLGLAEKVFACFDTVYIPNSTLSWLFKEKSKASFHQPSRIKNAHLIRNLISTGMLLRLDPRVLPNSDLSSVIGSELSQLLSEAKVVDTNEAARKYVVRPSPVHRVGSLRKGEADLSKYFDVLCSCQSIVDKLIQLGRITQEDATRCGDYLKAHERDWPSQPQISDRATLYLDSLAIAYFLHLGLIDKLAPAGFKVFISKEEIDDGNRLILFEQESGKVRDLIETIRSLVSDGLHSGKVKLTKYIPNDIEDDELGKGNLIYEAVRMANCCDAVIVDDRFFNRLPNIDGGEKLSRIGTSLDLLRTLLLRDKISYADYLRFKTRLREACFFLIPLEEDELLVHLDHSSMVGGKFVETPGLRAIREYVLRVRMSNWITLPDEAAWLDSLFKVSNSALKKIWKGNHELEVVTARADWLLELADLRGWASALLGDSGEEVATAGCLPFILMIAVLPPNASTKRKSEYWDWVESRLIRPIKEEVPSLYASLVEAQKEYFNRLDKVGDSATSKASQRRERQVLITATMKLLSPTIRSELFEDSEFCGKHEIKTQAVLRIGDSSLSMDGDAFVNSVKKVLKHGISVTAKDLAGEAWLFERLTEECGVNITGVTSEVQISLPNLYQYSPNRDVRIAGLKKDLSKSYLASTDARKWELLLRRRTLSRDEFGEFGRDLLNSPGPMAERVHSNILRKRTSVSDLVPHLESYYERLVGKYDQSARFSDYAAGALAKHLAAICEWDSSLGISFGLMTAAHPAVSSQFDCSGLVETTIMELFSYLSRAGDPISVIGGIEVGLRLLAEMPKLELPLIELIKKVIDDDLDSSSRGIRLYVSLAILVQGEFSRRKIFSSSPPYYRRLASMAHAALLYRQMVGLSVEIEKFHNWVFETQGMTFYMQALSDMRQEPRWTPDMLEPSQVKAEIIGRIILAAQINKAALEGKEIHDLIFGSQAESVSSHSHFLRSYMPGPLEGEEGLSPMLPEKFAKTIDSQLNSPDIGPRQLFALLNSVPVFSIDEKYARMTATMLRETQYHLTGIGDREQLVTIFSRLACLAASARSVSLSDELLVLMRVYRQDDEYPLSVEEFIRVGVEAAASRKDLRQWCSYVGKIFGELAFGDITEDEATTAYNYLQHFSRCIPQLWKECSRADAALQARMGV